MHGIRCIYLISMSFVMVAILTIAFIFEHCCLSWFVWLNWVLHWTSQWETPNKERCQHFSVFLWFWLEIQSPISSPDDTWVIKSDFTLFSRGNTYCTDWDSELFSLPHLGEFKALKAGEATTCSLAWGTCVLPGAASAWKRIQIPEGQRMRAPYIPHPKSDFVILWLFLGVSNLTEVIGTMLKCPLDS